MKNMERFIWGTMVLALAGWGLTRSNSSEHEESIVSSGQPTKRMQLSTSSTMDGMKEDRSPGKETAQRTSMASRSKLALRSDDRLERLSEFLKILAACDSSNFDQVKTTVEELKASGISLPMEEELMNFRAGQLKGAELLTEHTGSASDFEMLGTLKKQYEGWVQENPQEASNWLENLPAGKYRDQMAVIYIAANTKDDPSGSLKWVASLHPSQQIAAGRAVAQRLAETASIDETSTLLDSLESSQGNSESPYLKTVFDTLITNISKENEGEALSLITSHLDQPFVTGSVLASASAEKAKDDPVAALEWATSMEGKKDDIAQGGVITAAIRGMTLQGLADAESWISTHGSLENSDSFLQLIENRRRILEDRGDDHNDYDKGD